MARGLKDTIRFLLGKKPSTERAESPPFTHPFTNRHELAQVMNSNAWCNMENLNRLAVTFPEINSIFSQMNQQDYTNMVRYVELFSTQHPSGNDRLIGLFSALTSGVSLNTESALLNLGYSLEDTYAIKDLTEAVSSRHPGNIGRLFSISSTFRGAFENIMNYAMWRENIMFNNQCMQNIIDLKENTDFLLSLQDLGFSPSSIYKSAASVFVQHLPSQLDIPHDGIKLHISATDKADYRQLVESVVPDLIELGATFKVLNLSQFDRLYEHETQAGKAITLYESPSFNAREFFRRHPELLMEQGHEISGDKSFGGRVYGRYGCFIGHHVTDPRTGAKFVDDRTTPVPDFVKDITLNDFINSCDGIPFQNFEVYPWMREQYGQEVTEPEYQENEAYEPEW